MELVRNLFRYGTYFLRNTLNFCQLPVLKIQKNELICLSVVQSTGTRIKNRKCLGPYHRAKTALHYSYSLKQNAISNTSLFLYQAISFFTFKFACSRCYSVILQDLIRKDITEVLRVSLLISASFQSSLYEAILSQSCTKVIRQGPLIK